MAPGATLGLFSLTSPVNKRLSLTGDGVADTVNNRSGNNTLSGPVSLANACPVRVQGNGGILTCTGVISGSGALVKKGGATGGSSLVLTAANTYTGNTTVTSGTIALTGSGSISSSAVITVESGATLSAGGRSEQTLTLAAGQILRGDGTVSGNLVASAGSIISPGLAGIGRVAGDPVPGIDCCRFTLRGSLEIELDTSAPVNCDGLTNLASVELGGSLSLVNIGPQLQAGDTFTILSAAAYSGAFSTHSLPALSPPLVWDTSHLAQNGTVKVADPATSAPIIVAQPQTEVTTAGQTAIFEVTVIGAAPLTYQWRFNGANLPGATSPRLVIGNVQAASEGNYDVVITNPAGTATSSQASLQLKTLIYTDLRLVCSDGSPLVGCEVTLRYFDSGPETGHDSAITDSDGRIHFAGAFGICEDGQAYGDGHFVVTASCCPNQSWTINTICCCGDLGTLVCNECKADRWVEDTPHSVPANDIRDTGIQDNTGDPGMTNEIYWASRAIWNRRHAGFTGTFADHQNPLGPGTNYIHVLVRNRGALVSAPRPLQVFNANANMGLAWPWNLVGTAMVPSVLPGQSVDVEVPWTPQSNQSDHYCFIAKIAESGADTDLVSVTNGLWPGQFVPQDNNLCWRNMTIVWTVALIPSF